MAGQQKTSIIVMTQSIKKSYLFWIIVPQVGPISFWMMIRIHIHVIADALSHSLVPNDFKG